MDLIKKLLDKNNNIQKEKFEKNPAIRAAKPTLQK